MNDPNCLEPEPEPEQEEENITQTEYSGASVGTYGGYPVYKTSVNCEDKDGDGFSDISCGGLDCNDNNALINPDAEELCDGIDNNCNGVSDTATSQTYNTSDIWQEFVDAIQEGNHQVVFDRYDHTK